MVPSLLPEITRSIPARTGEPTTGVVALRHNRVYPRTYGGTVRRVVLYPLADVYPRTTLPLDGPHFRSIPARTGEPSISVTIGERATFEVYPRTYGGTPRTMSRL